MHAGLTKRDWFILSILGALSLVSPFAIDMYLAAVPQMAKDMGTTSASITLTISSYFIGMALGQVFYGPLLDRYGRKKPLYIGLAVFILASIGCLKLHSVDALIALRFLQALGGSAAQVGAVAMVHDFFPVNISAKIFSLLFLFIAVSPLFAPSAGSFVMLALGWQWIFILLAIIVFAILLLIIFRLPEGHVPDPTISLAPKHMFTTYFAILRDPVFHTYALAGAFSFAGLFTYVAGSPIIFLDGFHVSARIYGGIFALLSVGFIGASQVNVALLRRFASEQIFICALFVQVAVGAVFLLGVEQDWYGLYTTILLLFLFLACVGCSSPNGSALALAPFTKNAGSASALLGFIQLGIGALISTGIGFFSGGGSLPIIAIMAVTATIGLIMLLLGRRKIASALPSPVAIL